MTVYVDALGSYGGPGALKRSCHMMADTDAELERFARGIGIPQRWKHVDHYDLAPRLRVRAVEAGAVEVTSRMLVVLRRKNRGVTS